MLGNSYLHSGLFMVIERVLFTLYSDSHFGGSQANKRHGVSFFIRITGSQIVFQFFKYPFGEAIFSKNVRFQKKSFSQI